MPQEFDGAVQSIKAITCSPLSERAVLDAVERCRTLELGGHVDVSQVRPPSTWLQLVPQSALPSVLAVAQAKWIAGRPSASCRRTNFHVVFTLPAELRGVARSNPALVNNLLFHCAVQTLLVLGRDPAH